MLKIRMEVLWDYFGWGFVLFFGFFNLRNAANNLSGLPVVRKLEMNE